MKSGLRMYINGKKEARDKGGVGVQNMKDWKQHDNFCVGRNVGGNGVSFTNFYIASFVVFKNHLKAQTAYSVYKYYNNDGEINVLLFAQLQLRLFKKCSCPILTQKILPPCDALTGHKVQLFSAEVEK